MFVNVRSSGLGQYEESDKVDNRLRCRAPSHTGLILDRYHTLTVTLLTGLKNKTLTVMLTQVQLSPARKSMDGSGRLSL